MSLKVNQVTAGTPVIYMKDDQRLPGILTGNKMVNRGGVQAVEVNLGETKTWIKPANLTYKEPD